MKPQKFSINDILTREPPTKQTIVGRDETSLLDLKDENQGIPALPTPPLSPEPVQKTKEKSQIKETPKRTKGDMTSSKRKRDPIGQILDSLCNSSDKKDQQTPSAFSPIVTSSCTSQLSPLGMLAHCDRRCYQTSPSGVTCTSQSPPSLQGGVMPQVQMSVEQLQYLHAQRLAHQQYLHQQQQQQQQHIVAMQVAANPFLAQQQNQYHLQMLREQHAKLMSYDFTNASMGVSQNSIAQNAAAPLWMAWLKSSSNPMTSHPLKESRIPPPPRYQCDACKKSYSTFGGLSKHKQFHCVSHVKKEFNCKYCEKSYGSLGALKMHIRTHTLPCKCKLCGKAFSRPWLLQGHVRTHTGEKPFKCVHCGRAFADRSNLRAHLQTHSDIKKYGCKNCTKTFSRMSLLLKHEEGSCLGLRR
ncbi:chorion transcription factor Cf2-like [Mercenaria mercenaria]|uniref:chorion transcription factor Cf2-like n=1 Tax=Mercenaria mercenaria TaxID=6596 RepID=UPI00234E5540|nr:chorion transcription factor Cf2-like [Mercenaria mercenaria]